MKRKTHTRKIDVKKVLVIRGVENATGFRYEAGTEVLMEDFLQHFSRENADHWLTFGVLEAAEPDKPKAVNDG